MKIENVSVMNIENAIRGMRNPLNSWDKSDSGYGCCYTTNHEKFVLCKDCEKLNKFEEECLSKKTPYYLVGEKDLELAKKLVKAGSSDRKFLRQIFVSMDITGPIFFWKELDQYKVGTTTNSQSTMHRLASTPITLDCFETGDYDCDLPVDKLDQSGLTEYGKECGFVDHWHIGSFVDEMIDKLEELRVMYNKTGDKAYWKELIRWLPESWLQTRTWTGDYETLRAIYHQRKSHKLTEWHTFCRAIEDLPYSELITF